MIDNLGFSQDLLIQLADLLEIIDYLSVTERMQRK